MKLFLSWSGSTSREVALALRDWLPYVIQSVNPFVSTGDIAKGRRWSDVLATELSTSAYGIICLTPYNIKEPWIHFEAGAISKALDASSVSPFLFRVSAEQLQGPLQQFQSTIYERNDVFSLLISINNQQDPDHRVPQDLLRAQFDVWWPKLQERLDKVDETGRETETGFPWLYSRRDLERIEGEGTCNRIWIVTPDLYRHTLSPETKDGLQRNLKRGVQYTFVTDANNVDLAAQALRHLATAKGDQVRIQDIQEDEFRRLAATDYIFINPDSDSLRVFFELPIATPGYWIQVEGEAAIDLVTRFRSLADGGTSTPTLRVASSNP